MKIRIQITPRTKNCKMCYGRGYLKSDRGQIMNCICNKITGDDKLENKISHMAFVDKYKRDNAIK